MQEGSKRIQAANVPVVSNMTGILKLLEDTGRRLTHLLLQVWRV